MRKIFILFFMLFLFSCQKYKETNPLAIPPIANDELKITIKAK